MSLLMGATLQAADLPGPRSVLFLKGSPVLKKNATPGTFLLLGQQAGVKQFMWSFFVFLIYLSICLWSFLKASTRHLHKSAFPEAWYGPGVPDGSFLFTQSPQGIVIKHRSEIWKLEMNGIPPYLETYEWLTDKNYT